MEGKTLLDQITKSINSFIHDDFQPNPFDYLYEADIQSAMWSRLKNDLNIKIKWEIEDEEIIKKIGRKYIETSIVKAEYPHQNRFDIGIISPNSMSILKKGEKLEGFWNQKLLLAIELKYLQYGLNPNRMFKGFLDDMDNTFIELANNLELGLALLFVQSGDPQEIYDKLKLVPVEGIEMLSDVKGYFVSVKGIYEFIR